APSRQRSQIFLGQRRAAAPNGSRAAASSSSAKARAEVRTAVSFAVADPWSWMAIGNSMWSASAFPLRCRGPDDSTALRLYSIRCLPSSFSFEHIDPEAARRLGHQREAFVISGEGGRPCEDPAQCFLTPGFL